MENKNRKKVAKDQQDSKSTRLSPETLKKANRILQLANKKSHGRKVKIDQVLNLAFDLVTDAHIKTLQAQSLKNSDRQEILRKKYSAIHGPVSMEDFIGITMTPAYFDFLKEHGDLANAV